MHENRIGSQLVTSAIQLHRDLGPGLMESVYERLLAGLLESAGHKVQTQVKVPIHYKGLTFEDALRADLIIDDRVIVEIKSVEQLHPRHKKQLLTYLRLTNMKLGYVLNFGSELMKQGILRVINGTL